MTTPEEREARDSMCDSAPDRITLCLLPDNYLTPNTPEDAAAISGLGFSIWGVRDETYGIYGNGILAALSNKLSGAGCELLILPADSSAPARTLKPETRELIAECVREELAKVAETKAVLSVSKVFREVPVNGWFAFDGRTYQKFCDMTGWNPDDISLRPFHPYAPVRHFGPVKP